MSDLQRAEGEVREVRIALRAGRGRDLSSPSLLFVRMYGKSSEDVGFEDTMRVPNDDRELTDTDRMRRRYDRLSGVYDLMQWLSEQVLFRHWRRSLLPFVRGRVLEVGVGTGKNLPYYPSGSWMLAVDLSRKMLRWAVRRAEGSDLEVRFAAMDAQHLALRDRAFDTVVATFVFCSVPDPRAGLRELDRVCRAGGRILLLEHVRSGNRVLGRLMDVVNPLVVRLIGGNIDRETVENVRAAGLEVTEVRALKGDIFKRIRARSRA